MFDASVPAADAGIGGIFRIAGRSGGGNGRSGSKKLRRPQRRPLFWRQTPTEVTDEAADAPAVGAAALRGCCTAIP